MLMAFDFRAARGDQLRRKSWVCRGFLPALMGLLLLVLPVVSSAEPPQHAGPEPPSEISTHFDAKARAGKKDMLTTLRDDGHFETLLKAIKVAGLDQFLKTKAPLTMFVPTDDAFAKLPAGTLERWMKDPKTLKNALRYHIIKAYVPYKQMLRLRNALMVNGATARFDITPGEGGASTIVINWEIAKVTRWDIMATNGVMHATDNVIVPPRPAPDSKAKDGKKKDKDEGEPAEGNQS